MGFLRAIVNIGHRARLRFERQPPAIQAWLARELDPGEPKYRDEHSDIREFANNYYPPPRTTEDVFFLRLAKVKSHWTRVFSEAKEAEFLNVAKVAEQLSGLLVERAYGHDILPKVLPDIGTETDVDTIFLRLFGLSDTDHKYLIPYLAALARFEWKRMDPRMRNMLLATEKKILGTGKLPSIMIREIVDHEMETPRQRLETRALARIYWQVYEMIRTHVENKRIKDETANDVLKRRTGVEIADFETANSIASHALDAWSSLNDDERLVFDEDFDVIERGLPKSFFVTILHLKDKLAKMETRYIVAHVRAMLNDFAKLTGEQMLEMRIQMSPRTGKPQISIGYILDWYDENDDHDDADGTGGTGNANQGPPVLPPPPEADNRGSHSVISVSPGSFRTAIAGIRNFFSLQMPIPSPVVVPMNLMPLGVFNPIFTVI